MKLTIIAKVVGESDSPVDARWISVEDGIIAPRDNNFKLAARTAAPSSTSVKAMNGAISKHNIQGLQNDNNHRAVGFLNHLETNNHLKNHSVPIVKEIVPLHAGISGFKPAKPKMNVNLFQVIKPPNENLENKNSIQLLDPRKANILQTRAPAAVAHLVVDDDSNQREHEDKLRPDNAGGDGQEKEIPADEPVDSEWLSQVLLQLKSKSKALPSAKTLS